jgi:hypothetical protein
MESPKAPDAKGDAMKSPGAKPGDAPKTLEGSPKPSEAPKKP